MTTQDQEISAVHAQSTDAVAESLGVDPDHGLSEEDVERRREEHGLNQLPQTSQASLWRLLGRQLQSMVVYILFAASMLAAFTGRWPEAIAVIAVIVVNTAIGFISEWRARHSMQALRQMRQREARVLRDQRERMVTIEQLVPGDVVLMEDGDVLAADVRLVEANALRIDESMLTGESVTVQKMTEPVDADAVLADRTCMAYRGTVITEGSARGIVVATGAQTELGHIAQLAGQAEQRASPLKEQLDQLGGHLAWITIIVVILVAAGGLYAGQPTVLMIETAIALGVAAIPEGLPVVATIALAHGMWLMAKRQALVNRLPAVETLGATTIILSDKTGTVTENHMRLGRVITSSHDHRLAETDDESSNDPSDSEDPYLTRAIEIGVLCNNASLRDEDGDNVPEEQLGDPTELALLHAGFDRGVTRQEMLERFPEVREVAFNPNTMRMATVHENPDGGYVVAVKGAPSAVLEICDTIADGDGSGWSEDDREKWRERAEELAADGLRVLALAEKEVDQSDDAPYEALRFVALIGLHDPPREGVEQAITNCRDAGIRVAMVTGDQPATAESIAAQVGIKGSSDSDSPALSGAELGDGELSEKQREKILQTNVFARVSPEQKLRLVECFQRDGHVAAMTGDGVNDTPALEQADIGVAMGRRGTDAAREAADMVLRDDAFDTIVAAVHRGRIIFQNIRRSAIFMLCTNGAEVFAVALASVIGLPPPLRPLQILYLNVITDVFPALALSVGPAGPDIMKQGPRQRDERVLTSRHWSIIAVWSVIIGLVVLAALTLAHAWLGLEEPDAVTISFLTLAVSKLWFVFNLRAPDSSILRNGIVRNPWIWGALVLCAALLAAAVYLPGLSALLDTRSPSLGGWTLIIGLSLLPLVIGQVYLRLRRSR